MEDAFFIYIFNCKSCLQESQISGKVLSKEGLRYEDEHQMSEHLKQLNINKPVGNYGMHSQVLRELADVIARWFLIIMKRFCQNVEVPGDCEKGKEEGTRATDQSA